MSKTCPHCGKANVSICRRYRILAANAVGDRYGMRERTDSFPLDAGIEVNQPSFGRVWVTRDSARRALGLATTATTVHAS